MKKAALVIMAAGMASRYGGNKQIDGMGPNGEILMEYSIRDAIRAGFTKVVFIIKPEMKDTLHELCGRKYEDRIELCYAFQTFDSVPAPVPAERTKPFGTVHAVLCARDFINEPFAVINADDYYGIESFQQMFRFLTRTKEAGNAAMIGYKLANTVSLHGAVTRGICRTENDRLMSVREIPKIQLMANGDIVNITDPDNPELLDPLSPVSMNFWGFDKHVFEKLDEEFRRFLEQIPEGNLKAEYLLPIFISEQLKNGELAVTVLPTNAIWFGVTYKEDRPAVAAILEELHHQGLY